MNASAFRDIWARVMFCKVSKLHEPQASAIGELEKHHISIYHEMHERSFDFLFIIFSTKL